MFRTWLERQWQITGWAQLVLWPLSCVFALLASLRRSLYQYGLFSRHRLPVPVIVVGNISVGGVGKTPVVLWLAQALREAGWQPGIISRGYGGQQVGEVKPDSAASAFGDEPVLLAQRSACPVWVNAKRVQAGLALCAAYPQCDVLISDDGLQHDALQRSIEIAVVQRPSGIGNGRLLPAGPLRESMQRLQTVDIVIESGDLPSHISPLPTFQMQVKPGPWTALDGSRTLPIEALRAQPILAIAGIGHPERFFAQLSQQGLVFETRVFADHHQYTVQDFAGFAQKILLMTEKDAVKCRHLDLQQAWYLPITANISPRHASQSLLACVLNLLQQRKGVQA